jgi:sugar phosphate isomerase/epimerase/predicted phosphodiesterase
MSTLPLFAVIADAHIARAPGIQDRFLEAALAEAKSAGARFAVIAGDLVEDGHHSSFTNAKAILSASGLPCYPVIGNKEVSQNSPQRYISNFGPTYYTVQQSGYRLIVLGTTEFTIPQHKLRWLEEVLAQTAPHDNTVLVAHHYLERFSEDDRGALTDICGRYGVRHMITAHRHRMETTQYGPVTEHMLQAVDPDKALGSPPGFTLCGIERGNLHTRFVPMSISADLVQRHLTGQLGFRPTRDREFDASLVELAERHGFRHVQLIISGDEHDTTVEQQARVAADCGLQLVGHLPSPQFDITGQWLNRTQMHRSIEFFAELLAQAAVHSGEAPAILHPPKLPADVLCDRYGRLLTERTCVQRVIEAYVAMVGWMQQGEMAVALENNSSKKPRLTFGALPSHLTDLSEELRQRSFDTGYCFDIGHVKASVVQTQVAEWMAAIGDRLLALHLHSGDPHSHVTHDPVTELYSTTRWLGLAAWLAQLQVVVPCLFEVPVPEGAAVSAQTLHRLTEPIPEAVYVDVELAPG